MSELYPPIHENRHFHLKVDDVHDIYVEECGNEDGVPVVFLHGGPGAGCELYHRQLFNPEKYRIILFDQRGCGRSHPHASLENNTTQHLIADMEKIREELGVKKWVVAGGSWGSTLALAYAETYPQRVSGLIVRGIFLATTKDVHWFYQEGASRIYPDYWEDFVAPIPENERDNLLNAYHKRLTGGNEIARMRVAKSWSLWEARTATLQPSASVLEHFSDPSTALSVARIEAHYFVNESFFEADQLLKNASILKDIPGFIIHGRYDMICPIEQAYALQKAWPLADFFVVQGAGHSAGETGITAALIKASDDMLKKLEPN
ncbi:MAG: prolyl aminopeptidase [Cocleimonas sp.]|nr:prolyl aminopeptidase [Cocleimonas sp.]